MGSDQVKLFDIMNELLNNGPFYLAYDGIFEPGNMLLRT